MYLADPELELLDPTPSVHALFVQFDKQFFSTKLASRAVVRWSKRMYSCAGICSYEGRGGLCDIALSEPLLKLRPRKDLVETLLHEMIHAFLFVTNKDQDRNGHGPNFQAHMHRINRSAGLNITIYHDFHDEVKLYQTHWWRCNGPCTKISPYFGIVRRSANRAPGPSDFWWKEHKRKCGGTFIKLSSPEKKTVSKSRTSNSSDGKRNKNVSNKPNADITKYIITNKNINSVPAQNKNISNKQINNTDQFVPVNSNSPKSIAVFTGNGYKISNSKPLADSRNVTEHVRNIWANKQISNMPVNNKIKASFSASNPNKHKAVENISSPPAKIKKINDYFKANATLQDLYGEDYKLVKPHSSNKLVAVNETSNIEMIDCPVCNVQIDHKIINKHLDECLNKDIIEKLTHNKSNEANVIIEDLTPSNNNTNSINLYKNVQTNDIKNMGMKSQSIVTENQSTKIQASNETLRINTHKSSFSNTRVSDIFVTKDRGDSVIESPIKIKLEAGISETSTPSSKLILVPSTSKLKTPIKIKTEPATTESETSRNYEEPEQKCPCCGKKFSKPVEEHLDECLAFIIKNEAVPNAGAGTSSTDDSVIVIDDDGDVFDESLTHNATGTKTPCPCCMKMVEAKAMNHHLDLCLGLWND